MKPHSRVLPALFRVMALIAIGMSVYHGFKGDSDAQRSFMICSLLFLVLANQEGQK